MNKKDAVAFYKRSSTDTTNIINIKVQFFPQKCTTMHDILSLEPLINAYLINSLTFVSAPLSY